MNNGILFQLANHVIVLDALGNILVAINCCARGRSWAVTNTYAALLCMKIVQNITPYIYIYIRMNVIHENCLKYHQMCRYNHKFPLYV